MLGAMREQKVLSASHPADYDEWAVLVRSQARRLLVDGPGPCGFAGSRLGMLLSANTLSLRDEGNSFDCAGNSVMTEYQETVLLAWARDADGDNQRFTGDDIYRRVGFWCTQRLQRDIPTVATYYCRMGGHFFTNTIGMVPDRAIPLGVRLRRPDEIDTLGNWVLWAYKAAEDA